MAFSHSYVYFVTFLPDSLRHLPDLMAPKELGEGYVLPSIVLVQQMDSLLFVKIGLESQLLGLTLNLYQ